MTLHIGICYETLLANTYFNFDSCLKYWMGIWMNIIPILLVPWNWYSFWMPLNTFLEYPESSDNRWAMLCYSEWVDQVSTEISTQSRSIINFLDVRKHCHGEMIAQDIIWFSWIYQSQSPLIFSHNNLQAKTLFEKY